MSKYLAIMSKKLMSNLTYRLATVLNMLAMSTYFLASYYFWQALIAGGARPDANIRDLMFYSLLSEIVIELCYSNIAGLLEGEIQDGSVAMHFIRPISFRLECFSLSFGENLYWTSVFVLPAFVTCALLVGLPVPASAAHGLCFAVSLLLGLLIRFEIGYVAGLMAFWLQKTWYLDWYINGAMLIFGGTKLPLWFYPKVLERISRFLPFRYVSFEPINIYLGRCDIQGALLGLGVSAAWLLALHLAGRLMWSRAARKLTINGG